MITDAAGAKKTLLWLIIVEFFFATVYAASSLMDQPSRQIHTLFDLDGEGNIPAWFSSMQLLLIGLLFLRIGRKQIPLASHSVCVLSFFGAAALFLAFDEAFAIHEKISFALRAYPWIPRLREKYGLWMPIYAVIGGFIALVTWRDLLILWRHYRREARIVLWGGAIFVLGAVGMEIVKYQFLYGIQTPYIRGVGIIVEEMLEMAGASLALYGVALLELRLANQRL